MARVEHIGNATLYWGLTRSQRHRLRKKGINIPRKPMPKGYKQAPEHVAKRKRPADASRHWLGDQVSKRGGRTRALRTYRNIGPCAECGATKAERHHNDENPANNESGNITILCRRCHMAAHRALKASRPVQQALF